MFAGLEARYYAEGAFTTDAVEVCRSIRRARYLMDLTVQECIQLQVAAMAGAAGAWRGVTLSGPCVMVGPYRSPPRR